MNKWIQSEDEVLVDPKNDPGAGLLRVVMNLDKALLVEEGRQITVKEATEVIFGKGRSTHIEQYTQKSNNPSYPDAEQHRIAGLTNEGRPLLVIIEPRDAGGVAKRVVTAWQLRETSGEFKKLMKDVPNLRSEYDAWKKR